MSYQDRPNTGVLFKNKEKKNEKSPDYQGNIVVDKPGKYRLSAWINKKNNNTYMSLKLSPFIERNATGNVETPPTQDNNDGLPF